MGYLLNPYSLKASNISYRYIKWYITDLRNKSVANSVQVSEFRLRNLGSNLTMSGTATNPGGSNPGAETPSKVIDGSTSTKWLDFNIKSSSTGFTSTLIIDMGVATTFDGYTWWTANDVVDRDPKTWQILGSNDNSNYTLLHEVTGFTATTSRRSNVGNFTI